MNDMFCTYFDHHYLSRAVVMFESFRHFEPNTPIYVLALSEQCESVLRELALPHINILPLATLEAAYPDLAAVKSTRTTIEYYFTLSPLLPHYLFAHTAADRITYIDCDLYFFSSPRPFMDSLGDASVAITPHRFSFAHRDHTIFGKFNVGWITYRRCAEALDCLNTYKAECLAWCYDRVEDDRFGDQKYLDAWPDRYPSLRVIEHKGFNLAVWNAYTSMIRLKNGAVMVDDDPLVFYHFASTTVLPDGSVQIMVIPGGAHRSKAVLLEFVIDPYKRKLEEAVRSLSARFPVLAQAKSDIRDRAARQAAGPGA
jgi:hypothetical protein